MNHIRFKFTSGIGDLAEMKAISWQVSPICGTIMNCWKGEISTEWLCNHSEIFCLKFGIARCVFFNLCPPYLTIHCILYYTLIPWYKNFLWKFVWKMLKFLWKFVGSSYSFCNFQRKLELFLKMILDSSRNIKFSKRLTIKMHEKLRLF